MITVLRQYFSYFVANSRTFDVALDITMKVEKQPFFLLPVKGYMADLRVLDSEGKEMIVLSDKEFEKLMEISMSEIIELYVKKLKADLSEEYFGLFGAYRVVAVLFNRSDNEDYYEKVRVTWIEKFENKKSDGPISQSVQTSIYLPRYGFEHGATSAIYLSIRTSSKYTLKESQFRDLRLRKVPEYKVILEDTRHKIYRFSDTPNPQLIEIIVRVGLPSTIKNWAQLGLAATIIIPSSIMAMLVIFMELPEFSFEILLSLVGFIAGLRVLIFRDLDLMQRWNTILFIAVIFSTVLLLVFNLLAYCPELSVCISNIRTFKIG
jgi:hypothetical protein